MARISVLGSGAWGTALAFTALCANNEVNLWSPFESEISLIEKSRENPLLPGLKISSEINLTGNINCIENSEVIILAVPSFAVEQTAKRISKVNNKNAIIVNVAKGFDPDTTKRFSQIVSDIVPNKFVVLSGPSHAEEVANKVPTSVVVSGEDEEAVKFVQSVLMTEFLRIYVNTDLIGVELGGALKNVIALASGICDGLGTGDNTKAALITRGLAEITRLGIAMGAKTETFSGLSGLGDLIVTCDSMHSRNRRAGILIGRGMSASDAVKQVGTVEGYYATKACKKLSEQFKTEMPIAESCYRICFENHNPQNELHSLMVRPKKSETEKTSGMEK